MRLCERMSLLSHRQDGFPQQGRPFKRRLAELGDIPNAYRVSSGCWGGARVSRAPFWPARADAVLRTLSTAHCPPHIVHRTLSWFFRFFGPRCSEKCGRQCDFTSLDKGFDKGCYKGATDGLRKWTISNNIPPCTSSTLEN